MKTSNNETLIIRDNIGVETAFTIKATGKAFKILSDGLYTDKILAIIRELSCNAYDAHVAAGKSEVPFDVYLPTSMNPEFRIRDYGTGLDHDQVMHLYTSYFESTKTDSNDFIGALGLGSKSPFSYVDSFIVNSYFNGIKRLYTAFIAEQGVPSITLLGEESTKEDNGLEIIVPIAKFEDHRTFTEKAAAVYRWFKVRPNVRPALGYPTDNILLEGTGWKLFKSDRWYSTARAMQGNVVYPISADSFTGNMHVTANKFYQTFHSNLLIEFEIGDLEVAASREALSMDNRTQQTILERMAIVKTEMFEAVMAIIESKPTRWEAQIALKEIWDWAPAVKELINTGSVTYKGEPLHTTFEIHMHKHPKVVLLHWYSNKRPIRVYNMPSDQVTNQYRKYVSITPGNEQKATFWIDDIGYSMQSRIRSILGYEPVYVISADLPDSVNPRKPDEIAKFVQGNADIDALVKEFGGVKFRYVSEIPKPERQKNSSKRKAKFFTFDPSKMLRGDFVNPRSFRQVNTHRLSSRVIESWTEKTVDVVDVEKSPWMETYKFIPSKYKGDLEKFGKIYSLATHLKLIQDTTPVYGVREKDNQKLKLPSENEFTAYLRRLCEAKIKQLGLKERIRMNSEHLKAKHAIGDTMIEFYAKSSLEEFNEIKAAYAGIPFQALTDEEQHLYDLGTLLDIDLLVKNDESDRVIALHRELMEKYPLLIVVAEHQRNYWNTKIDAKAFEAYVKAIDFTKSMALA